MKKSRIIVVIIVLVLAGAGYYFYNQSQSNTVQVSVSEVENVVVAKTVSASGVVKAFKDANISSTVSGTVEDIGVTEGEVIKKGQILGRIFNNDLYQNSQSLKDSRDVALRDLDLYIENYETNTDAVGGTDEYTIAVRRLRELVSKAEASYNSSLSTLSKSYLKAPFDSTVIDIVTDVGETVIAGTTVLKIAAIDNLFFEIELDQEDFGLVELGQNVEVVLDSFPDTTFTGVVSEMPFFADETSEDFVIKVTLEPLEDTKLFIGMNGDAEIKIEQTPTQTTALIFDSVFEDQDGTYVWIVDGNEILQKEYIEVGLEGDIYTQVLTNLNGKTVVTPISDEFEEGDSVEIT